MQSSTGTLSTWKKWSNRINFKNVLNKPSFQQSKRRKVGIANVDADSLEELKTSKPAFSNNNGLYSESTGSFKNIGTTLGESNSQQNEIYSNGNVTRETLVNSEVLENGNDKIINNHKSSPFTIKNNGFMIQPLKNSAVSKPSKKKKSFLRVISKSSLDRKHASASATKLPNEEQASSTTQEKIPNLKYNLTRRNTSEQFTHLGLLTPAFVLHPSIHHEHILTKKLSDNLGGELQLNLAAAHINDAINGRGKFGKARAIFKPSYIQKCYRIISSSWWAGLLYLTIVAHCLMTFWEQPDTGTAVSIGQKREGWTIHPVILVIDAVCVVVYIVDIVLYSLFFNWKNIWHSKEALWIRVEFVFTCMFVIDYAILLAETFTSLRLLCIFRCLRAFMLLCKSKNVSHIFNVLLSIISKLGKVLLIIAIFIVTFASVGIHIFMEDYHLQGPCPGNANATCNDIYNGAFDNVAQATLHMFVLMSTENYPEFIIPAFDKSWANFFFFGLFLYAGVFFLTAILLAIIVESYWDYSKRHVKVERRQQREELAKAWNLMDPLGKGQIPIDDPSLLKLFTILKPKNTAEENQELISYLSGYVDGFIYAFDWTTRLIEALSFEFEEEPELIDNADSSVQTRSTVFEIIRKICRTVIHANAVTVAVLVFILLHSILFSLMWTNISNAAQLGIQSARTCIVVLFCFEALFRIIADGKNLLNVYDALDISMIFFAAIADIAWYVLWFYNPPAQPIHLGACVVVSGLAVLIRAVFNSKHARTAVRILRNIYPVMFDLILLVMTIIFNFAVIGFEIFQDKNLDASSAIGYEGSYLEYGCGVGFETFGCSLLIVFQIVTTNDWQEIMLGAMEDSDWSACFYFLACYLIVDMIVMNLFVAISIEAYKKLANDNTTPMMNNIPEIEEQNTPKETPKADVNFATSAKNALGEIFAPSRKSKTSVTSNTLTGYTSSPFSVRRGTLGSLGQRTPTPSPIVEDRRLSIRSASTSSYLSVSNENVTTAADLSPPVTAPSSADIKRRSLDRRQIELKKRQQRKKEVRKSKLEESRPTLSRQSETKLQIDDVVNLKKRVVRVVKGFNARSASEMNIKEGDMIAVSGVENDMLLGPKGWFPAANVEQNSPKPILGHSADSKPSTPKEASARPHHRVQFDVEVLEKKPRQTPPPRPRISQTRMIRKNDGTEWRRDILGDMTVMNKDEMQDLNRMLRGGLGRRHNSQVPQLRNTPSQFSLRVAEDLREEDEEESLPLPQLTVSEVKPEPPVLEDENSAVNPNDTTTLTLSVPQPRVSRRRASQEKKKNNDGSMPDWMQKFVSEKQIALDKDVKLDDSVSSSHNSDAEPSSKDTAVKNSKPSLKRKRVQQSSSKA